MTLRRVSTNPPGVMNLTLLFLIQFVWASSYISQKMALAEMPIGLVLIFRYGIAALFFLMAGQYTCKQKFTGREWLLIVGVGILNFAGSPYFQLKALTLTYAMDVSVLVAFEPLIVAWLAVCFLKERVKPQTLLVFLMATCGVLIMASSKGAGGSFQWLRLMGDALFFCSLLCEGIYSVSSRHLVQKHPPLRLLAWMVLAGCIGNLLGNYPHLTGQNLRAISPVGWLNLCYLALICSCMSYTIWVWLLKKIPVNQLALSLFLQPILGSMLAFWLLKERLDGQSAFGALLILTTLLIWLRWQLRWRPAPASWSGATSRDSPVPPPSLG